MHWVHNPVQWSHYGDRHRDICLGFDVVCSSMTKVRYVDERIKPNLRAMKKMGPDAVAHMLDLLTLKFRHWEYEQEYRLFVRLNDKNEESDLYFYDFGAGKEVKLQEVIVGALSPVSPEQVAKVLGDLSPGVKAQKATLAFRTFDVVRQRNQDLWRPSQRRVGLREPSFESLVEQTLQREDFTVPRVLIKPCNGDQHCVRHKSKTVVKKREGA
jgi:hypothetical protein